jgi:hypothetical protein
MKYQSITTIDAWQLVNLNTSDTVAFPGWVMEAIIAKTIIVNADGSAQVVGPGATGTAQLGDFIVADNLMNLSVIPQTQFIAQYAPAPVVPVTPAPSATGTANSTQLQ